MTPEQATEVVALANSMWVLGLTFGVVLALSLGVMTSRSLGR